MLSEKELSEKEIDFLIQGLDLLEEDFDINAEDYKSLRNKLDNWEAGIGKLDNWEARITIKLRKEEMIIRDKILSRIRKLKSYGTDCLCDERESYSYIFQGEYPEIITVCLRCGGSITDIHDGTF